VNRRGFLGLLGAALGIKAPAVAPEAMLDQTLMFVSRVTCPGEVLIGQTMAETFNNLAEATGFTWSVTPESGVVFLSLPK